MYGENQAVKYNEGANLVDAPRRVVTEAISSEITEQNRHHAELIGIIEDKLHNILNLRSPEKSPSNSIPEVPISDFAKHMEQQLSYMRSNGNRLDKIISHLQQIV